MLVFRITIALGHPGPFDAAARDPVAPEPTVHAMEVGYPTGSVSTPAHCPEPPAPIVRAEIPRYKPLTVKALGAIGALLVTGSVSGQSLPQPGSACNDRHTTALGQVACELVRALPREDVSTLVIAKPVRSAARGERLDELGGRLASLVAGELGPIARTGSSVAFPASGAAARTIVVELSLEADRISGVADVLSSVPRFWERLRGVATGSKAHAFAARPLDAEIRSYLPAVPLVVSRVDKTLPLEEPSIAVACGDADADGSQEIVSVGRQRVQLGRVAGGRYLPFRVLAWSSLSEVASAPLREPIASAVIRGPGALEVGLSDRADALAFDSSLRVSRRSAHRLPWPGGGCAVIGPIALAAERAACEAPGAPKSDTAEGVDATAGLRLVRRDGTVQELLARRRQRDSRPELQLGNGWVTLAEPVGAQMALADLDGDGRAELLTTSDSRDPREDFLRVQTLGDDGAPRDVLKVEVPVGVHALGVCPARANAMSPVVLATGSGLWILQ